MTVRFWNNFTKITGWPVQKILFRTRIRYEDKAVQGRRIKGPAIVICNHTSLYDYAVLLFVFFSRTVLYQMAELLFDKPLLGWYLKKMGGIRVDRNTHDYGFLTKSEDILRKGGVVGIFPESRLPKQEEERPLPFVPSVAYLALACNVPIIPVYTNGSYFKKKPASVLIGTPLYAADLTDDSLTDKENVNRMTEMLREKIIAMGKEAEAYEQAEKRR